MPQRGVKLVPLARSPLCCRYVPPTSHVLCGMSVPVFHLMFISGLLPAVRVLVHVLNCSAHNALPASGHLQLPASHLAGVEDSHPPHHEMPCAH